MSIKNKRAMEGGMWWIIIGAIVAIIVAGVILYIVKGGLSAGKENIDVLASCKSRGGECKLSCPSGQDGFYKYGDCAKNNEYCCIPKT